jgi:2-haloacid dehalogenase
MLLFDSSNSINEYHLQLSPLQRWIWQRHPCKVKVTNEEIKATLSVIKSLQTYPDVIKGLQLLKENGFRLATLLPILPMLYKSN